MIVDREMKKAAREMDFERAAKLRDEIKRLEAEHGLVHESKLEKNSRQFRK